MAFEIKLLYRFGFENINPLISAGCAILHLHCAEVDKKWNCEVRGLDSACFCIAQAESKNIFSCQKADEDFVFLHLLYKGHVNVYASKGTARLGLLARK